MSAWTLPSFVNNIASVFTISQADPTSFINIQIVFFAHDSTASQVYLVNEL